MLSRIVRSNAFLVFASIAAVLAFAEIGFRFFITLPSPYAVDRPLLVWDARGYWVLEPGAKTEFDNRADFRDKLVTIDGSGMRDVPCRSRAAGPRSRNLFLVGDSETFGWGLSDDESWPNRLQCLLDAEGMDVAVHNLGVPATNIDQYAWRMSHILGTARPGDIVALMVTWNDLVTYNDVEGFERFQLRPCPADPAASEGMRSCVAQPVQRYGSEDTWRQAIYRATGLLVPEFQDAKAFAHSVVFSSALAAFIVPRIELIAYRIRPTGALFAKLPEDTIGNNFAIIGRIAAEVERLGLKLKLVFLPARVSYDDHYYQAYSKAGAVFARQDFLWDMADPFCRAAALDCISSFPALAGGAKHAYSFGFDGHLNPAGAERLARFMHEMLRPGADHGSGKRAGG